MSNSVCPQCKGMGIRMVPGAVDPHQIEVCPCKNELPSEIAKPDSMRAVCPMCDGMGMRVVERADGGRLAEPCACQHERKVQKLWRRAQVPRRYENCTLENFKAGRGVSKALMTATRFVENYFTGIKGTGILFSGSCGLGKTHLAVGIVRKLTMEKGTTCLFCDYRDLLKQITNSYNKDVQTTELGVLQPIFETEVLVLDELGAAKPTEWVWDTVALILNARYNGRRTTILTTNFPNLSSGARAVSDISEKPVAAQEADDRSSGEADPAKNFAGRSFTVRFDSESERAEKATRSETLGDRIGQSMWSRLQEMCVGVELSGPDYRQTPAGRARFG